MASLLRFRRSTESWSEGRVTDRIYRSLDDALGAEMTTPWFAPPADYEARRFEMDNGDIALFAWTEGQAYWMGNTETPEVLWRTEKYGFGEVPAGIADWAERELLAQLHEESPWLADYPHLSWYFLPVFLSKDGRETSRAFFAEHAAGFPIEDAEPALEFYESFLASGVLDDYRHLMAGKLGTSEGLNLIRMTAAMGEFNAAYVLDAAGYEIEPEAPVSTGHSLDFRVETNDGAHLAEVTHPAPPHRRSANSAVEAVKSTARTKVDGQLDAHGGGVLLLVDCTSFTEAEWDQVKANEPAVGHRPAVVYRLRPEGTVSGYADGRVPIDLGLLS
ncbi:MAG: DUF5784 family protein [Halodesulfurarchaeum sp.]